MSDNEQSEQLVKYSQLTEAEQEIMWRVWMSVNGGMSNYDSTNMTEMINLQNFGLIYQAFNKYRFTKNGQSMMVAEKIKERQSMFIFDSEGI